ncbi:MAG: thioredoxin family protein [Alphaproteobacteria bacterium]|nr:thioredoxin family protein [Alphaproteobacteria bacterium]
MRAGVVEPITRRAARAWSAALAAVALGVAAFAAPATPAAAEPFRTKNVEAELQSSRLTVAPGETFLVALRMKVRPEWHTYWRNPGDSGAETTLDWSLPAGFKAGDIVWPTPKRMPVGPLVNYGYDGETLYPIRITAPKTLAPGQQAKLAAEGEWLVCKDICIYEGGLLTLTITGAAPGAGTDDPVWAARIAAAEAAAPKPADITARITKSATGATLTASGPALAGLKLGSPYFFPYDGVAIDHAANQAPVVGRDGLRLDLKSGTSGALGTAPLRGVLAADVATAQGVVRVGWEIEAKPGDALATGPVVAGPPPAAASGTGAGSAASGPGSGLTFGAALLFAFIGGLILNVMPCVLPVLSIKALGLAGGAHAKTARRDGMLFFAGVMVTFLALGGGLVALMSAGMAAGWGFQLQEPMIVGALAMLFFLIGLNLLGAFEIGGSVQSLGGSLVARGGGVGAFFTGALAVVAAAPCTAPFMAGALGFAVTQPPAVALSVFAALGAGFALPMTALSFAPAIQRRIPRPGPWMDTFKQALAFPMFGAAVWMAWVLTAQAGASGALVLLTIATATGFLVWTMKASAGWQGRIVAMALALAVVGGVAYVARPQSVALVAEPWSPARVEELTGQGRTVFVNFTADWCVTCKVNERTSLSSPRVAEAFAAGNVAYLKADWTARDDVIAAALKAYGRPGVPLYLVFPGSGGAPKVLPQTLTEDIVIDAVRPSGAAPRPAAS